MSGFNADPLFGLCVTPAIKDAAAWRGEYMDPAAVDHGELKIPVRWCDRNGGPCRKIVGAGLPSRTCQTEWHSWFPPLNTSAVVRDFPVWNSVSNVNSKRPLVSSARSVDKLIITGFFLGTLDVNQIALHMNQTAHRAFVGHIAKRRGRSTLGWTVERVTSNRKYYIIS